MRKTLAPCIVLSQSPTLCPAHTSFTLITVLLQNPRFPAHTSFRRTPDTELLQFKSHGSLHTPHSAELRTPYCCDSKVAVPCTHLIPQSTGSRTSSPVAAHLIPQSSGHCIAAIIKPRVPAHTSFRTALDTILLRFVGRGSLHESHSAEHQITFFFTGRCKRSTTRVCCRESCVEERHRGSVKTGAPLPSRFCCRLVVRSVLSFFSY